MADESTNVENVTRTEVTMPEKKYTDDDVNNISKKESEKAISKLLRELGITDKAKAKSILANAAEQEQTGTDAPDERVAALNQELAEAQAAAENAVLESLLLLEGVSAEKAARAVGLLNRSDCRDEEGKFNRDNAKTAVSGLMKEWPELKPQLNNRNKGFSVGADMTGSQPGTNEQLSEIFGNKK